MDALNRTLPTTRRVLGDVDPAQPLDLTHPLLRGVQGFWLPLPRLTGGSRLYDLSPFARHATINHGASAWREGTFNTPSLFFPGDGNDGYAYVSSPKVDIGVTVSIYLSVPLGASVTNNRYDQAFRFGKNDILLSTYSNYLSASGQTQGKIWNGSVENEVVGTDISGQGATLLTMTWGAEGMSLYENCTEIDSNSFTGTANPLSGGSNPTSGPNITIGSGSKSFDTFQGQIASVYWANRALGSKEVQDFYDQARQGFPDLLNRRDSVGLLGGGGGPTADTVSFGTGTALADGFDPTITATANTVSPGTGQAAAQGFSVTVTATQNTVAVGTAQAAAQGFGPTISADPNTIAITIGQAPAQGFDPTISEGAAGDTLVADLGTAQAQGFAPSISAKPATVTLGLGEAEDRGFDTDVVADPSEINTGQAQAAATGFDPTVTTNARVIAPQLGTAQADGFEPAVVDGTVGVATTMEIEARPLYEIDVEAKPLYRIRLFVKEQLP
jgi:hypothetical protein